jgi:hypothetical protein
MKTLSAVISSPSQGDRVGYYIQAVENSLDLQVRPNAIHVPHLY